MILASDLHLTLESEPLVVEVFEAIRHLARETKQRHLVLLGDTLTVRHDIAARLLSCFNDCLLSLGPVIREIDIVIGNHDQWNLDGRHVLEAFEKPHNIERPCVRIQDAIGACTSSAAQGENITWLPWCSQKDAAAVFRPPVHTPYLMGHLAVRNAWMNNLRRDEEGLPLEVLKASGFRRIFLGHYHLNHFLDEERTIEYVGSPYQTSYAEAGQKKGVIVFDPKTNTREFVELNVGPKHHKIVVDADRPEAMALPQNHKPGDKLWVQVKGQMAGTLQETIAGHLRKAGLEVARFDIDMQTADKAARAVLAPEDDLAAVGVKYVEAQDMDPGYKALLLQTFRKVVPDGKRTP